VGKLLCLCGCGEIVKSGNKFICYHHRRGVSCSEEQKAKISKTLTGRTLYHYGIGYNIKK
jgi:hypothetical protein